MRWLISSSLKFRRLIVAAAVGVIVVGIVQLNKTAADVLPEFNPPMVEVQTEALGLSAEEVEQLITVPLEQDLLVGVAFLDEIESVSLPGLSSVVMTFEPGTDLLDARQVVQERLTQAVGVAGLPEVAKPPQMIQPLSSHSRVAMIKLTSEKMSPIDVSVLARWVIGPRLMSTPGVANVVAWGNRDRQLQVLVDPERLSQEQTTLANVIETAGNALEVSPLSFLEASTPGTGGFIDTPNQRLNIFHEQSISTPGELAQVPLTGEVDDGVRKSLGDVADVVENHQPLIGDAVCRGGEDCLLLVVEKFPGANTVEVTEGVESAIDDLGPGLGDIKVDSSVYRPASYVESSFGTLGWGLLIGGILLLLVLGAFIWDWRRLVISASVIVVSVGTALLVLQLRDTTVNLMIVAGLAAGLTAVIHDPVSDMAALARRPPPGAGEDAKVSGWRTIVDSCVAMRRSIFYALLIAAAATLPVFFMQAEGEAFLPPIALSYLLAVAASMLVALTLTPALAVMFLGKETSPPRAAPVVRLLQRGYDRVAPRLVSRTGLAIGAAVVIAVIGIAAVPFLDTSFRPSVKERDVLVHVEARPGTSLPSMTATTAELTDELGSLPGVSNVGSHVGRAVMSDESVDVNSGEIWVSLEESADYEKSVSAIESTVEGERGVTSEVLTYSEERVTDVLERDSNDLVVRVYGENAAVLDDKANEVRAAMAGVEGVTRATVDRVPDEQTLEVQVDLQRAQEVGVKPGDVRRAAASTLGGITVGNLFDEQKVFDVVVWGAPGVRDSVTDIEQLLIQVPSGGQVALGEVADVGVAPNPSRIEHEAAASYLDVTAQVAGGENVGSVAAAVDEQVRQVSFPLDHHAELLGGYAEERASQVRVTAAAVAAIVAAFLLLQAAFRSWRVAIIAFLTLPLALVGGLALVLARGGEMTLGSMAGLLAVLGIAARGVVVLVHRYQRLEQGEGGFGPHVVLQGTREALGPTVTTVLGTAAMLVPIAVVGQLTGFVPLFDMVVVLLGGLVTTVVVDLFVVPILYLRFGFVSEPDAWSDDLYHDVPERVPAQSGPRTGVMQRIRWALPVTAGLVPVLLLSSCGATPSDDYVVEHEPGKVLQAQGSDDPLVVIERSALDRLEIRTSPVTEGPGGLVVPAAAVFVDTDGAWQVYTREQRPADVDEGEIPPGSQLFLREEVDVTREAGGKAFLSNGPPAGTEVVTVGVPEVAGIEEEIADH